jgi:hypothetical protein
LFLSMGLAFDPMETNPYTPAVYFTSNDFFTAKKRAHPVTLLMERSGGPRGRTDIIVNLPMSDIDHGINAMEFGDKGELYVTIGSNTNGGVPGPLSQTQKLKENFLSAAVNVAYLADTDFDGTITWSDLDDGDMDASGIESFAFGLRNPYGLVLHSNGELYATDNGPNWDYGKMLTSCNGDYQGDQYQSDRVVHVVQDAYYGHPNLKRAATLNDPRQCVWRRNSENDSTESKNLCWKFLPPLTGSRSLPRPLI